MKFLLLVCLSCAILSPIAAQAQPIIQDDFWLKYVAFDYRAGWVMFYGDEGYTAHNLPSALEDTLSEAVDEQQELLWIAFTRRGGWLARHGGELTWRNIPDRLAEEIFAHDADSVSYVAIAPNNGWVMLYNYNDFIPTNIAPALEEALQARQDADAELRIVEYADDGEWIVISDENSVDHSEGIDVGLIELLDTLANDGAYIYSLTIGETDEWVVIADDGIHLNGVTTVFDDDLQDALSLRDGARG